MLLIYFLFLILLESTSSSTKVMGFTRVFNDEQEAALASYINYMESRLIGLTSTDLRNLAFEFAEKLRIKHNFNRVKIQGLRTEKLVGAAEVRKSEFKHIAAIMYKSEPDSDPKNLCVGVIISSQLIATAALCFYNKPSGELKHGEYYVIVGSQDLLNPLPTSRSINVDTVTIHILYQPTHSDDYDSQGNVAVLKLVEDLGLVLHHPTLAKVLIRRQSLKNYKGSFYVAGYGFHKINRVEVEIDGVKKYDYFGRSDGKLRYGKAVIMNDTDCFSKLSDLAAPGNMCVTLQRAKPTIPAGVCMYDNGAPITHKGYLDGLAITGYMPCDDEMKPSIFIDILYYYNFIMSNIREEISLDMRIFKIVRNESGEFVLEKQEIVVTPNSFNLNVDSLMYIDR